jgi:hypothetical protein
MVQMTAGDQKVVMALPGNKACCDCGMKGPQWASVSFGNIFCLDCSGVHRYVRERDASVKVQVLTSLHTLTSNLCVKS